MKRFSIIFLGALAIMMASCSKDVAEPSPSNPDAWKTDITLPVPVEFGMPRVATKADYIEDISEDMLFGVFGINREATALDIDRNNEADPDVLLNNALAVYSETEGFHLNDKAYYPMTNTANFNFYAYYQAVNESEPAKTPFIKDNDIYVSFAIGREDILYGSSKVTEEMEEVIGRPGFNGAYIRKVREKQTDESNTGENYIDYNKYNPYINFQHVTAALQFYVKTSSELAENVFVNDNISITRVALTGSPIKADLCVVDLDTESNEGKFTVPEDDSSYRGLQYVYQTEEASSYKYEFKPKFYDDEQNEEVDPFGMPVFIVPTSEKLTGYIALQRYSGGKYVSMGNVPFTIDPTLMIGAGDVPINEFKAGHRYNITLVVHSPEAITIEVSIEGWKDGFTGGDASDKPGHEIEIG